MIRIFSQTSRCDKNEDHEHELFFSKEIADHFTEEERKISFPPGINLMSFFGTYKIIYYYSEDTNEVVMALADKLTAANVQFQIRDTELEVLVQPDNIVANELYTCNLTKYIDYTLPKRMWSYNQDPIHLSDLEVEDNGNYMVRFAAVEGEMTVSTTNKAYIHILYSMPDTNISINDSQSERTVEIENQAVISSQNGITYIAVIEEIV